MAYVVTVSANVGDICDGGDQRARDWVAAVKRLIVERTQGHEACLVGLHLQELGGTATGTQGVAVLAAALLDMRLGQQWSTTGLLWHSTVDAQYTALGVCYYVRCPDDSAASMWSFVDQEWLTSPWQVTASLNAHARTSTLPDYDGRKGFIHTKWRFGTKVYNMVNVHLPSSSCNIKAAAESPSVFAVNRQKHLSWVMEQVMCANECLVIAGDFNFRLDLFSLVPWLQTQVQTQVLLERKAIVCPVLNDVFTSTDRLSTIARDFDLELQRYNEQASPDMKLFEPHRAFAPTYRLEPGGKSGLRYGSVRFPGWCDRLLLNAHGVRSLRDAPDVANEDTPMLPHTSNVHYSSIVTEPALFGDHAAILCCIQFE